MTRLHAECLDYVDSIKSDAELCRTLYDSCLSISNDCEMDRKLSADKSKKARESEESAAAILVEVTKISGAINALSQSMKTSELNIQQCAGKMSTSKEQMKCFITDAMEAMIRLKNQAIERCKEASASAIEAELMLVDVQYAAMGIQTTVEELEQFQHYLEEKEFMLIKIEKEKEGYWVIKQKRIEMLESELIEIKKDLVEKMAELTQANEMERPFLEPRIELCNRQISVVDENLSGLVITGEKYLC
jgi:hypothetical protein